MIDGFLKAFLMRFSTPIELKCYAIFISKLTLCLF
jgi:hypothetical protein